MCSSGTAGRPERDFFSYPASQVRDNSASDQGGISGDGEKWSNIRYVLKLESINWWYIEFKIWK